MNLIKKTDSLFPNIPSLFDNMFGSDLSEFWPANFSERGRSFPAVNILESDKEFTVELVAPGMNKKDFNISLENDCLTISSEIKQEAESKSDDENYFRKEFSYQSFQRSFRLPEDIVRVEKIKAEYKEGILKIILPKQEVNTSKLSRRIEIR